jgi:glycosyltransferase involved in cell wall biosynthesis
MAKKVLHQVVETITRGDATSDHAFLIRGWLRDLGFESEIYTANFQEGFEGDVRRFSAGVLKSEELLVAHHTIGSAMLDELIAEGVPLLLIYHNITPHEFFAVSDPALARQLERGREQLQQLRPLTRLALGASPYSELELQEQGFANTGVLPIVLNERDYDLPVDEALYDRLKQEGPLLLFVGRVVPNKRQEDLVKLLYFLRRFEPSARLALVGGASERPYLNWLNRLAGRLGLSEAVTIAGHVSQQEMITTYRAADLFVSMSEHEGFGKPLIESMYFDVPVLAYGVTAVPSTLGDAGILFARKDYEALAELCGLLLSDQDLRAQIIQRQRGRVAMFLEPQVREQWTTYLQQLGLLGPGDG